MIALCGGCRDIRRRVVENCQVLLIKNSELHLHLRWEFDPNAEQINCTPREKNTITYNCQRCLQEGG